MRRCGQADDDTCLEWMAEERCGGGDLCEQGACVGASSCVDECTGRGTKQCKSDGTTTCGQYDADPCLEWGPVSPCPANESCSNGACARTCVDECSVDACSGTMVAKCGQYDLDACSDLGPPSPCPAPANGSATCTSGRCGFACNVGYVVSGSGCASATTTGAKVAFVTSTIDSAPPSIGAANQRCATAASNAGLTGTFKAWISDDTWSARDLLAHASGPYVLVDQTVVAASWTDLADGRLSHAIDKTELGGAPVLTSTTCGTAAAVWTGTDSSGYAIAGHNCANWSASSGSHAVTEGDARQTSSWWTSYCSNPSGNGCAQKAALYCFEQ